MTYSPAQDALAITVSDGGGTFYADTMLPCRPQFGYAVGHHGAVLDARFVDAQSLAETAKRVGQEWGASLVGTWLEGNTLYVDAVRVIANQHDAFEAGRAANQKAIYGFAERRTFYL